MALNEQIIKRKSFRKYDEIALTEQEIEDINKCIESINPILEDASAQITLLTKEQFKESYGGMFVVNAPYYIVIHGENKPWSEINGAFMGQTLILALTAMGYGTCWQGGVKPKSKSVGEASFICAFAFGRSQEEFRMLETDADRKKMDEIAFGEVEAHLEALRAARLAPSAMNVQPVRYLCAGNRIHIFRQKTKSFFGVLDKVQTLDCGIAAANIVAAMPNYTFHIERLCPTLKGCIYCGTLSAQPEQQQSQGEENE